METNDWIFNLAKEKGFSDFGVCSAEKMDYLLNPLEATAEVLRGFVEVDINKRITPKLTMAGVASIVVFAKPYNIGKNFVEDEALRGVISQGAVGEDYHIFMKRELGEIAKLMEENLACQAKAFSDTGPLCDRELAIKSGVGYKGKNQMVIGKNGGTCIFVGYILTTALLSHTAKLDKHCPENCNACLNTCPTRAISMGLFEPAKCISLITQKKGLLSYEEMKAIGTSLYGCDICQEVCPECAKSANTIIDIEEIMPQISLILKNTNSEFEKKYGKTAMGWRGNTTIKRNALCALGNIGSQKAIELLVGYINSESTVLRHTAVKSLVNIGGEVPIAVIKQHLEKETKEEIRREILWAIGTQGV